MREGIESNLLQLERNVLRALRAVEEKHCHAVVQLPAPHLHAGGAVVAHSCALAA